MNIKQKKFILEKLIPFILREEGRGFGMDVWLWSNMSEGSLAAYDGVVRKIPVCGTAACIGGSAQILLHPRPIMHMDWQKTAKDLGLPKRLAHGLFFVYTGSNNAPSWPKKFAREFEKAKTPFNKAQVATALLKEVVKTNGRCLEAKHVSK